MTKGNDKRGLMARQPAAQMAGLDFAHASEAMRRAQALPLPTTRDEAEVQDALIERCADALIAIPTRDPAHIGEKVSALVAIEGAPIGPLSDPAVQFRVAASENKSAKRHLAIYLDLTASAADRSAWDAAVSAVADAMAQVEAINTRERETDEDLASEWAKAWDTHGEALEALLNTRAPDAEAMGLKARLIIEKALCDNTYDAPDNPDTLARLMGDEGWSEHAIAAIYQDGLALSGIDSPAARAVPESFDSVAWVTEAEAAFGVRFTEAATVGEGLGAEGRDTAGALAAYAVLAEWKQSEARHFVSKRQEAERRQAEDAKRTPTPPAELRALMLRSLLNTYEDVGEREAVRADLASVGLLAE